MAEQIVRADVNPQLCKTLNPEKHKWEHAWIAEPKFDGLRCIIIAEKKRGKHELNAYSRNGKPLWNMDYVLTDMHANLSPQVFNKGMVFDGEIYTKDWNLSMSIVKRSVNLHPDSDKLQYHVWDCLTVKEWKAGKSGVSNLSRKENLAAILQDSAHIQKVIGVEVTSQEELTKAYTRFLEEGYEGAILKEPSGAYECGRRSPNWLKIKPWTDADLTVIGAYAGKGKHEGRLGGLVLEGALEWNGHSYTVHTEVGTGFTDAEREQFQGWWDSGTLNGRIVEIKFQDVTVDGACRFPVYSRLREDKTMSMEELGIAAGQTAAVDREFERKEVVTYFDLSQVRDHLKTNGGRLTRKRYAETSVRDYLNQIQPAELATQYVAFYDANPFFQEVCAGAKHHHWWKGGLETHCSEMIGLGMDLMDLYPGDVTFTKSDVIIAVFLHDFSKVWNYRYIYAEERAKTPNKFKDKQVFTYVEGAFSILDVESTTLLALGRHGVTPTDKQWSAVLFAEGGYATANFNFRGVTNTGNTVNHDNPLAPFLHILDMYSSQLLGRSIA